MTRYNPAETLPKQQLWRLLADAVSGLVFTSKRGTMYRGSYSRASRTFWGSEYWNNFTNDWYKTEGQGEIFDIDEIDEWWYE